MSRVQIPVIRGALPAFAPNPDNKPVARSTGRFGCPHAITEWLSEEMNGPHLRRVPYIFRCNEKGSHSQHRTGELVWI